MSEREWDKLFELIEKAVNLDGLSASEKGELIRDEANKRSQEGNLDEFVSEVTE